MRFEEVFKIDVNSKTEKKGSLTYLSWAWAWAEFKKVYPDARYEVKKFDGLPYRKDDGVGVIVYTEVTAGELTYEMWLPVMDMRNNTILEPKMTDINKTIMRCLVKNLAMFGLGLYIYKGEDMPVELGEPCTEEQVNKMRELGVNEANVCRRYKVETITALTYQQAEFVITTKQKALKEQTE